MGDIFTFQLIGNANANDFVNTVGEYIAKFQREKLSVEVQYSTNESNTSGIYYTALVIARLKK